MGQTNANYGWHQPGWYEEENRRVQQEYMRRMAYNNSPFINLMSPSFPVNYEEPVNRKLLLL